MVIFFNTNSRKLCSYWVSILLALTYPIGGAQMEEYEVRNPLVVLVGISDYEEARQRGVTFSDLPGVDKDIENLCELFETKYGYEVHKTQYSDYTGKEFHNFLENKHALAKNYDSLILVLIGHGGEGTFITSDGKEQQMTKIKKMFLGESLTALKKRCKIFIKIACRGTQRGIKVPIDGAPQVRAPEAACESRGIQPPMADASQVAQHSHMSPESHVLTIYANVPGLVIVDGTNLQNKGSYLSNALLEVLGLHENQGRDLASLGYAISKHVAQNTNGGECVEVVSTLQGACYLFPRAPSELDSNGLDQTEESRCSLFSSMNLGVDYAKKGKYEKAIQIFEENLEQYRACGDKEAMYRVYHNLGIVYDKQELYVDAEVAFSKALRMAKTVWEDGNQKIKDVYQRVRNAKTTKELNEQACSIL